MKYKSEAKTSSSMAGGTKPNAYSDQGHFHFKKRECASSLEYPVFCESTILFPFRLTFEDVSCGLLRGVAPLCIGHETALCCHIYCWNRLLACQISECMLPNRMNYVPAGQRVLFFAFFVFFEAVTDVFVETATARFRTFNFESETL